MEATNWDKISKIHIFDRGLLPIVYKELQLSNKKTCQLRSKRLERTLYRGKYTKGQEVYKKAVNFTYHQRNVN